MNSIFDSEEKEVATQSSSPVISLVPKPEEMENTVTDPESGREEPFILSTAPPTESTAETIRRSGLAYSAGIAFFASVVFMLVIGWGFDLLFGSSPWGILGGIVLGSIIGFVQFFRITSQIFGPEKKMDSGRTLLSHDDDQK
jgi:F0F1-type ATP synthase assembly protein I